MEEGKARRERKEREDKGKVKREIHVFPPYGLEFPTSSKRKRDPG
jgi:hypothetical protein